MVKSLLNNAVFYATAYSCGRRQLHVCIPARIIDTLHITDREEVKITIEKTGRVVPRKRFGLKKFNGFASKKESVDNDPAPGPVTKDETVLID